jgi:hypothetical protein
LFRRGESRTNLKDLDESFFVHLHDQRAMANVTISAVHNRDRRNCQ